MNVVQTSSVYSTLCSSIGCILSHESNKVNGVLDGNTLVWGQPNATNISASTNVPSQGSQNLGSYLAVRHDSRNCYYKAKWGPFDLDSVVTVSDELVWTLGINNYTYPTALNGGTITLKHNLTVSQLRSMLPNITIVDGTVRGWVVLKGVPSGSYQHYFREIWFVEGETLTLSGDMLLPANNSLGVAYDILPVFIHPDYLETYTVTFNMNGGEGSIEPLTTYGQFTIPSTIPTRKPDGGDIMTVYTFLGWSTDSNATTPQYVPLETVEVGFDIILYAIWGSTRIIPNQMDKADMLLCNSYGNLIFTTGGSLAYG